MQPRALKGKILGLAMLLPNKHKFKCKACTHQFSATSGTILASHKMSFIDLVAAIVILSNAVKGVSMLQLSRSQLRLMPSIQGSKVERTPKKALSLAAKGLNIR